MLAAQDDNIRIEKFELGPFGTNAYILVCRKTQASVLVDTPAEAGTIIEKLKGTTPECILITHSHMDHLGAFSGVRSGLNVPVAAHALDAGKLPSPPDILLNDGDSIKFGNLTLEVLHTPGHTPGSLCFRYDKYLISGDTIFPGGPGRTGTPEALKQIIESITGRIFVLPDDTRIYPGHGNDTVLKKEKDEYAVFTSRSHRPNLCGDVLWLPS